MVVSPDLETEIKITSSRDAMRFEQMYQHITPCLVLHLDSSSELPDFLSRQMPGGKQLSELQAPLNQTYVQELSKKLKEGDNVTARFVLDHDEPTIEGVPDVVPLGTRDYISTDISIDGVCEYSLTFTQQHLNNLSSGLHFYRIKKYD